MIRPKKSLGQNFLTDNNILNKILNLIEVNNNNIVEIGPGTGNLTKKILEKKPKSFILVEKDQLLTKNLKKELSNFKNVKIFNEDILKFNLEKIIKKNSIIIGNLPYNISSQILIKLIKFKKWLPKYNKLILMFQKEVADKILAKHKTSDYGRLSIITSARLKVTNHFNVLPNSFWPVPKVKSTVLVLEPIINEHFNVKKIENLELVSRTFFSQKRKMINKGFNKIFKNQPDAKKRLNINLHLRPSDLTENEFFKITQYFEKYS
jgi:16S rRNA (adenine1518-N6/adenine1519-N6)-dimethyltransferase